MKVIKNIIVALVMIQCRLFGKEKTKPSRFEYRLVVYDYDDADAYVVGYLLQKRKWYGWSTILPFSIYDLDLQDLQTYASPEQINNYIQRELGYIPRYAIDKYPHYPSDKIRRALSRKLVRLAKKLDESAKIITSP